MASSQVIHIHIRDGMVYTENGCQAEVVVHDHDGQQGADEYRYTAFHGGLFSDADRIRDEEE